MTRTPSGDERYVSDILRVMDAGRRAAEDPKLTERSNPFITFAQRSTWTDAFRRRRRELAAQQGHGNG